MRLLGVCNRTDRRPCANFTSVEGTCSKWTGLLKLLGTARFTHWENSKVSFAILTVTLVTGARGNPRRRRGAVRPWQKPDDDSGGVSGTFERRVLSALSHHTGLSRARPKCDACDGRSVMLAMTCLTVAITMLKTGFGPGRRRPVRLFLFAFALALHVRTTHLVLLCRLPRPRNCCNKKRCPWCVFVCVCVCVCVCMYACMYVYMCVCMYAAALATAITRANELQHLDRKKLGQG